MIPVNPAHEVLRDRCPDQLVGPCDEPEVARETGFGLKLKDELRSFADGWQEVSERIGQSRPLA